MSNRSKGHVRRARTCKCGRIIRGNAYAIHVRACAVFASFYRDYAPDVLIRYGISVKG